MAIPNLANTTQSYGVTKVGTLSTGWQNVTGRADNNMTTADTIASDYTAKVHTLVINNIDGSNAADVSVRVYNSATANHWNLATTISVPADTSLVVISADTFLWIEEGDSIQCLASANSDLNYVCSFTLFAD